MVPSASPRPDRTAQEIFDEVAVHLFTQRARSMSVTTCRYRGDNGRKCAIGALIADDDYNPRLELLCTSMLDVRAAARVGDDDEDLALTLQAVHDVEDFWASPDAMRVRLASVAGDFDLSAAVLTDELVGSEW